MRERHFIDSGFSSPARCRHTLRAQLSFHVTEAEVGDGENRRFEGPPCLLAVHFYAGVVRSALPVPKCIGDVGSFPLVLRLSQLHWKKGRNQV